MKIATKHAYRGIAALTLVIFVGTLTLSLVAGFAFTVTRQIRRAQLASLSEVALATSEAGLEEVVARIQRGETVTSPLVLTVGSGTATITNTVVGSTWTVNSVGVVNGVTRKMQAEVTLETDDVIFGFGVQVGAGGVTMGNGASITGDIHSNGSILGSAGAFITEAATVAASAGPTLDAQWTTNDMDYDFATASSNRDVAQSFALSADASLTTVSLLLAKDGIPPSDITVHISADDSGEPDNDSLASETIAAVLFGSTPSWINISFSSPPSLTGSTKYWIVLDTGSSSASDHWIWRADSTDAYASQTGMYDNNRAAGNPNWSNASVDFAFQTYVGGTSTKIADVTIGDAVSGEGYAEVFENVTVHGSACPNAYCFVETPAAQNLPISNGAIQDWRDDATSGGTCDAPLCDMSGNLLVSGSMTLGPLYVPGNLTMDNNATLALSGTIYVGGNIFTSNNTTIQLDPAYGGTSGILLTDGTIYVDNNTTMAGSGTPGSFLILLSDKDDPGNMVIDVNNNTLGVIWYAQRGDIHLNNNATALNATAYGIVMTNNTVITYDPLLSSAKFSSGPAGGYQTLTWKEVIL